MTSQEQVRPSCTIVFCQTCVKNYSHILPYVLVQIGVFLLGLTQ